MSRTNFHTTKHFQFEMLQYSHVGLYLHTLTVEGFGSRKAGYWDADIDRVTLNGVDVKPLLEINCGMSIIDKAATEHVRNMFRPKIEKAAA